MSSIFTAVASTVRSIVDRPSSANVDGPFKLDIVATGGSVEYRLSPEKSAERKNSDCSLTLFRTVTFCRTVHEQQWPTCKYRAQEKARKESVREKIQRAFTSICQQWVVDVGTILCTCTLYTDRLLPDYGPSVPRRIFEWSELYMYPR